MRFVILIPVLMTVLALVTKPQYRDNSFKEGFVWYFIAPAYAYISVVSWFANWDVKLYLGEDAAVTNNHTAQIEIKHLSGEVKSDGR